MHLPTSGIADACSRVPGRRHDFIECLLNPDGMVRREMNDRAQRLPVVKVILNMGAPRKAANAHLDPCVAADHLRFW